MTKYRIKPKRDFGGQPFLINGRTVSSGFVVTYNLGRFKGCNCMPGATWSETIRGALMMIRVLEHVGGERNSNRFWKLLHRVTGVTQRSRREQRDMMARMGYKLVKRADNTEVWAPV